MYSTYYVIHDDNTFELYFNHCTGLTYGRGEIKRGLNHWKFEYDSLEIRAPYSVCTSSSSSDSISVEIRSLADQQKFKLNILQKKDMSVRLSITERDSFQ